MNGKKQQESLVNRVSRLTCHFAGTRVRDEAPVNPKKEKDAVEIPNGAVEIPNDAVEMLKTRGSFAYFQDGPSPSPSVKMAHGPALFQVKEEPRGLQFFHIHRENVLEGAWDDEAYCLKAVRRDPMTLPYIRNQTEAVCLAAVRQNGEGLKYVRNQTREICLAAVRQNPDALQFVREQTKEVCLAAVQQNGWALKYVLDQTEEICLAAVSQNGWALEYVREQTEEICRAAVRQNPDAIEYVKEPFRHLFEEGTPGEAPDATPRAGTAPRCR